MRERVFKDARLKRFIFLATTIYVEEINFSIFLALGYKNAVRRPSTAIQLWQALTLPNRIEKSNLHLDLHLRAFLYPNKGRPQRAPLNIRVQNRPTKQILLREMPRVRRSESTKQKQTRELLRAKEEAARKREEDARRKVEEERNAAAKALERDLLALEVYRSQASTIQQHIDNAADNGELRVNLQKMLENCKVLWADKIKKAEMGAVKKPIQLQSQVFMLKDRLEKVQLMAGRASILLNQRARNVLINHSEKIKKLEHHFEEWTRVSKNMKKAMDTVEEKVWEKLDEVEKLSNSAWENAMKLMKEE